MAKVLWKRLSPTDFNAMSGSAAVSSTGGGARHIVLGRSIVGNDVASFLPRRGNQITIPTEAGPKWPKALLTFVSNPVRRNGEWYIRNQKNSRHPAWTAAAGFPAGYDTTNPPVVLVLEIDGIYHVDWRDQRTLSSAAPQVASRDRGVDDAPPALIAELLLQPRLSPVDAQVVRGQLQYVGSRRAEAVSSDEIVDSVRKAHLPTAARLADHLAGSNAGPSFGARFEAVHDLLRQTLTAERALQLAIHVRGLERILEAVAERLDEVTVSDIAIFTTDLIDLLNQLSAYRLFVEEAQAGAPNPSEAVGAAAIVAIALEEQPDDVVEPQLKQVVHAVRVLAEEMYDRLTAFALVRSVGNAIRAVGRFFNERVVAFARGATQEFDNTAGPAFIKAMGTLFKTAAIAAALKGLAVLFPGEFAFITHLMNAAAKLLIP